VKQTTALFFLLNLFLLSVSAQEPTMKILQRSFTTAIPAKELLIRPICEKNSGSPLFVVDGMVIEEFELRKIDPNDIESIWIFKDSEAAVINSCKPARGVVVITTKNANQRTITVKDILTGEPLKGASIDLISAEKEIEAIHMTADSLGRIIINKIVYGKEYNLIISNSGYKTFSAFMNAATIKKNYSVLLERNDSIKIVENKIKLYPNPLMSSQKINIEFEGKQGKVTVRLFSLDYKLINAKEYEARNGINKISFFINPQLSSGMYIVQLFDEMNHQVKTERLIIQ